MWCWRRLLRIPWTPRRSNQSILKEISPWWLSGKEFTCQCRRHELDPWVRRIPWKRKQQPTPEFLPEKSYGQRSLAGYSPWGHKSQTQLSNWTKLNWCEAGTLHSSGRRSRFLVHTWFAGCCLWLLEKAMAPHSCTLAWKIPWTEGPGRLQSMGSLRVRSDWATSLSLFTFMHWRRKWQPTPVFLAGESQGRGRLVGYCLWGHTESDTTEVTQQQQQQQIYSMCIKP